MRKTAVLIVLVTIGLNFISCSKESLAEHDVIYETQATEGDNSNDDDKPDI